MSMTRRNFMVAVGAAAIGVVPDALTPARAGQAPLPLQMVLRSPWMANKVALTSDNVLFLGLPRYAQDKPTPSLARREADGSLQPFPGNHWNEWAPGKDGRNAFVYLNSVHIFADDTVWCVDQGSLSAGIFPVEYASPQPGAQKLVQLDARTGAILNIIRFDETILPSGAQMNDLRFHGSRMYITDSGLGGIIVHDLASGKTMRRLSGYRVTQATPTRIPAMLQHIKGGATFVPPNSDMVEISADGEWFYWASPTGPFYRIRTRYLDDAALDDEQLAARTEAIFNNQFSGGCALDSAGNSYFSETETHHISLVSPEGKVSVLVDDPRLVRPDGTFISADRHLYIPVKQPSDPTSPGSTATAPFVIYRVTLPASFDGTPLGSAVTGGTRG